MKNYLQFLNEKKRFEKRVYFPVNDIIPDEKVKEDVYTLSEIFWKNGFELYLVGGCVRDAYIGKEPKDFDLVTNATPDQYLPLLKGYKMLPIGEAFGIYKIFTENDNDFELATFRKEEGYSDARHPDSVSFTDLYGDCSRRDLTINALYYDIRTEEIIDLVNGLEDIKNNTVRTVGKPESRFKEDKLRKLRAIRFAARFDSEIDPKTDDVLKRKPDLNGISAERIRDEFLKGIKSAKSVIYFLELIKRYGMFKFIFPELSINKMFIDEKDSILQLSLLLLNNDVDKVKRILNKMTYTTDEIRDISFLLYLSHLNISNGLRPIHNRGEQNVLTLKKLQQHIRLNYHQILKFAEMIDMDIRFIEAFLVFELTVDGEDVKKSGFKGAAIGTEIERRELQNFKDSMLSV